MSMNAALIEELKYEVISTRKILERVSDDKFEYKPHEKSMTMHRLSTHIVEMLLSVAETINTPEVDFATVVFTKSPVENNAQLLDFFDKTVADALEALKGATDENLMANWVMRVGDKILVDMPRIAVLRGLVIKHIVHHRGQLSVYLRLNDIPVPAIYGPSADDQTF